MNPVLANTASAVVVFQVALFAIVGLHFLFFVQVSFLLVLFHHYLLQ